MPDGYPAAVARKVVGVSQRCLDYWSDRGIVEPSVRRAEGKGSERRYSFEDLVKLSLVKRWRDAGLSLQKIRKGLEFLKKRSKRTNPMLTEILVTDGDRFFLKKDDEKLIDLLQHGQMVLSVIGLGAIREELQTEVIQLPESGESAGEVSPTKASRT